MPSASRASLAVVDPSPLLTVTIEAGENEAAEIHLHTGGQGVWFARMAAVLGATVNLCVALGGEPGIVLRQLIEQEDVELAATACSGASGYTSTTVDPASGS